MLNGPLGDPQEYLKTEIEVGMPEAVPKTDRNREYEAVNVKVTVSNTAPESDNWPKIVFLGVGLSIATHKTISTRRLDIRVDRTNAPTTQSHGDQPGIHSRTSP